MKRATEVVLLVILVTAASFGGADAYRLMERREWSLAVDGPSMLTVSNVRGAIEVIGWDRDEIGISAVVRIRANGKNRARRIYERIEFAVGREPGNISVMAIVPGFRRDSMTGEGNTAVWIDYSIRVPHSTDLDIESVTGDIAVLRVGGLFRVVSERGSIEMVSSGGEGVLKTGSGDIGCELSFLPPGGRLHIKTGNGEVSLAVPAGTSAILNARTRAGRVRVGLPMTGVEKKKRRVKRGLLGSGDGEIVLESAGGDVTIGPL